MSTPEPARDPQPEPEPRPEPEPEPGLEPEPVDLDELDRIAEPATVRRAPKISAFITFGVLLGALVGLVVALISTNVSERADGSGFLPFLDGAGAAETVSAVALGVLGGFVGALVATVADRRSRRR